MVIFSVFQNPSGLDKASGDWDDDRSVSNAAIALAAVRSLQGNDLQNGRVPYFLIYHRFTTMLLMYVSCCTSKCARITCFPST